MPEPPPGCPVLHGFDPLQGSQVGEPFEYLARARREMPVFYVPSLDVWCVTRMEDVLTVFRDTDSYSARNTNANASRHANAYSKSDTRSESDLYQGD